MQVKTILIRVQHFKGFVYKSVKFGGSKASPTLEVQIQERANSKPICSGCRQKRPGYDRIATRKYEFIPLWGFKVFLFYAARRVQCSDCGVKVE